MEAQTIEQYWRQGIIRELHKVHRVLRKKLSQFMMMPIDLVILDKTTVMWGCHNRFWWMMIPRNLVCSLLCIVLLSIQMVRLLELIFFLEGWNIINLVLSGCKVNLLAFNHVATRESSGLAMLNNWYIYYYAQERGWCDQQRGWRKIG